MKSARPLDTRQMPRYVGHLDGDLDIMGITIKQAIIHNAGEEFVVWVDEDGRVFVAPDTTRVVRQLQAENPDWIVNNYRSRWEIQGERITMPASAISEDLAFHRDERMKA